MEGLKVAMAAESKDDDLSDGSLLEALTFLSRSPQFALFVKVVAGAEEERCIKVLKDNASGIEDVRSAQGGLCAIKRLFDLPYLIKKSSIK